MVEGNYEEVMSSNKIIRDVLCWQNISFNFNLKNVRLKYLQVLPKLRLGLLCFTLVKRSRFE